LVRLVATRSQAALQREAEQRRAQLTRGLAALTEAAAPEGEAGGGGGAGPAVKLAGPEDVARVAKAVSDYEVLQVRVCVCVCANQSGELLATSTGCQNR
jgi:hypothetical protein